MAERRTKSDQFKAVRVYREKLDSITNGVAKAISDLDKDLDAYLKEVTIPPPADPSP